VYVLILYDSSLVSQSEVVGLSYKLDTVFNINNLKAGRRVEGVLKGYQNENLFWLIYKSDRKFTIECIDINRKTVKKFKVKNKVFNQLQLSSYSSLTIQSDTVFLCNNNRILGYKISNRKLFFDWKCKSIEYSFYKNGSIFLGRYYRHPSVSQIEPACLYKMDIRTLKIDSIKLKTDFLEYSYYLPARFISFNSNSDIAYTFFGSYKVMILNKNLMIIDSIDIYKDDWVSPSSDLHKILENPQSDINLYFPLLDKECFEKISRIELVNWIDTNRLLIRWYKYDTSLKFRIRFIDVLERRQSSFKIISSNIETKYPILLDSLISKNGIPLFSENYYTFYHNEKIVQVRSDVNVNPNNYKTYREYLKARNEYAKNHDPNVSIWIFKLD